MKLHLPLFLRFVLLSVLEIVPAVSAAVGSTWDPAWGAAGLEGAPDASESQYQADITTTGVTALVAPPGGSSPYDFTTYTAITLNGTGNASSVIVGGASATESNATGAVTRNSWIAAEQGSYGTIVGGSYADNWSGGAAFNFTGNSHIMVDGATVANIMGGNYKDGQRAAFTGNSYITIASGNVTGSIVGATVVTHNANSAFTGSTNIFVYTPLSSNSGPSINSLPRDMVLGGFGWATNTWKTQTLTGNTHVTVDLSAYSGPTADFVKHIVGGGFNGSSGNTQIIDGNVNVMVNLGSQSLAAGRKVVGGAWVNAGTSTVTGSCSTTITGGIFSDWVVGGSWTEVSGTNTSHGDISLTISGGSLSGNVLGATYISTGTCTMNSGDITISLSGSAALSGTLYGGYMLNGTSNAAVNALLGDVSITLDGASVTNLIGGSYTERNAADYTMEQGRITLQLNSGSIAGDVYAAGWQNGSTLINAAATQVGLSPDVVLTAGKTISGGYGGMVSGSFVTGTRLLSFNQAASYVNLDGVNFADFDVVQVVEGATVKLASLESDSSSLSKTGGGSLTIETHSEFDAILVQGGSLSLAGGISAASLQQLSIVAGASLSGVSGTITAGTAGATILNLALSPENVGAAVQAIPLISGLGDTPANMDLTAGEGVDINLSADGVVALLLAHRDSTPATDSYLTLIDGTLSCANPSALEVNAQLSSYGLRIAGTEGGSLVVNGTAAGLYYVTSDPATTDPHEIVYYPTLALYQGVIIEAGQQLHINLPGSADTSSEVLVNNLTGGSGSSLVVSNTTGSGTTSVVLSNQPVTNTGDPDNPSIPSRTIMQGSLTAGPGTALIKRGSGELVLSGGLSAPLLRMEQGGLELNGAANELESLQMSAGTLKLAPSARLQLSASSKVTGGSIVGSGSCPELVVKGSLFLGKNALLQDIALVADGASSQVDFGGSSAQLCALNGSGQLLGEGARLSISGRKDSTWSGSLAGWASLTLEANGDTFTWDNVRGGRGWTLVNNSHVIADITQSRSLTLASLTLGGGSRSELRFDTDKPFNRSILLSELNVEPGASLTLASVGTALFSGGDHIIGRVENPDGSKLQGKMVLTLSGLPFVRLSPELSYLFMDAAGNIILHAEMSPTNLLMPYAHSRNAVAGAHLLWYSTPEAGGELAAIYGEMEQLIDAGQAQAVEQALAAVAGASLATISPAFHGDMERRLRDIRNRMTSMGVDPCVVNENMPYYNLWANAEGDYAHRSHAGTAPGYKLERWGGTMGMDIDFTQACAAGMAFTVLYGDLSVEQPDRLDGDMGTYYLSFFGRYHERPWIHSLVATVGLLELDTERRLQVGDIRCHTSGSTHGAAFGLMYELAYDWKPDAESSLTLQPLVNISYRYSSVSGFDEHGSDVALRVDSQHLSTFTMALGGRLRTVVGETVYERSAMLECRALARFDIGAHRGDVGVALLNGQASADVQSATYGAFGVELGAGLSIPLGEESGTLFMDGSLILRSRESEFSGTMGFRLRF